MKLTPCNNQIIGRVVIKRMLSSIVRPDETKGTTKFVLIDAVGPKAQAAGFKVGDMVLVRSISNFVLDGGAFFRPLVVAEDIICIATDLGELLIQTDNGSKYVPFDDKDASKSICESESTAASAAA